MKFRNGGVRRFAINFRKGGVWESFDDFVDGCHDEEVLTTDNCNIVDEV